jgi:hypothetical protein
MDRFAAIAVVPTRIDKAGAQPKAAFKHMDDATVWRKLLQE